jgi:hypothetical protein
MRYQLDIKIEGDALTGDGASEELQRLVVLAGARINRPDLFAGQNLHDYNGNAVGHALLTPDWRVGEEVWVTTALGTLVRAKVNRVEPQHGDFVAVWTRDQRTGQQFTQVMVDQHGHDPSGKPLLGRVR